MKLESPTPGPGGQQRKPDWQIAADEVADALDADVLIYNGRIARPYDRTVIELVRGRERRPNVFFILVTAGGDPDAAFRMARILQEMYTKVIFFVSGYCKSAGTLVATAAHELVIDDQGELGPLDIQMAKTDELWETSSGLTVMEALNVLERKSVEMLEDCFMRIKAGSAGQITFRTASHVAVSLVNGLLDPIYRQIDPMHIGEAGRAMNLASDYGARLNEKAKNLQENALVELISLFSSHGFVIDRQEAAKYWQNVRAPSQYEMALAEHLQDASRTPTSESQPLRMYLNSEPPHSPEGADDDGTGQQEADASATAEVGGAGQDGPEAVGQIVRESDGSGAADASLN